MKTLTISKDLEKEIIEYCEKSNLTLDFDYRESLSNKDIETILDSEDGLSDFENELWEMNIDSLNEIEHCFIREDLAEQFRIELEEELGTEDENEIIDFLADNFRDYVCVSLDIQGLLNNTGEITCLLKVYSNYDCTNSFDTIESSAYLDQVYDRVKKGVIKDDFMYEHRNGAYGGSLFCFAFRTSLGEVIELKQKMKTAKKVEIPAGTSFGFFSSFQGAGSTFEKETQKTMTLKLEEDGEDFSPEYDCIGLTVDNCQSYSMSDVYGSNDFVNSRDIKLY